jgi:hypothetical protein
MAEQGRPPRGSSSGKPRSSSGGPRSQRGGAAARLSGRSAGKSGAPGGRSTYGRSGDGRSGDGRSGDGRSRDDRPRSDRPIGPAVAEHITGEELDRSVLAELRTLPEGLREQVARLLVAVEESLDEDPRLAWEYAQAAKRKAARVSVVREAAGVAAHASGNFAESLAELRAVRRMTGSDEHIALMADCERALGRPRKALELLASVPEESLSEEARIESRIVAAGARRDMGQVDAALVTLTIPALRSTDTGDWVGRLQYAYADTLAELGRFAEARTWFERAAATEADLDVVERLAELPSAPE